MKLGIIGGIGPLASYDFGRRLTLSSPAECDQQHINTVLLSDCLIPDRTSFILQQSFDNPLDKLIEDIKLLNELEVNNIAIICNTMHYFYQEISAASKANVYNMIELCLEKVKGKKVGLISTSGTKDSGVYDKYVDKYDVDLVKLDSKTQEIATQIIYQQVKIDGKINRSDFKKISDYLIDQGCDYIILGCTELSLAKEYLVDEKFIDPLDCLIEKIIIDYYGG